MTVRVAINGFDRIDYLRPVAEFGCAEIATVAMSDLNSGVSNAQLMVYAGKSDKFSSPNPKSRSRTVGMLQGIFATLVGVRLAKVEQAILVVMRSDAFLGSKWTSKELHFFLCEMLFGNCEDADHTIHAWRSAALKASIRRGLALLQHRGLVKYTVARQRWLSRPSEIKWSLVDAQI